MYSQIRVDAFDDEVGKDIIPVNLPDPYIPIKGQIIETMSGRYRVKGFRETYVQNFIARISLTVEKVGD